MYVYDMNDYIIKLFFLYLFNYFIIKNYPNINFCWTYTRLKRCNDYIISSIRLLFYTFYMTKISNSSLFKIIILF